MINFSDMNDRLNDLDFSQSIREAQKWDLTHNFSDLLDNPYAGISNFANQAMAVDDNGLPMYDSSNEVLEEQIQRYGLDKNNNASRHGAIGALNAYNKFLLNKHKGGSFTDYTSELENATNNTAQAMQTAGERDAAIMSKLAEGGHNVIGSMTGAVQALGGKVGGHSLFKSLVNKAAGLGLDPSKILGISNTGLGLGAIAAGALGAVGLTAGIIKLIKAIKKKRGGKQAVGQSIQQSNVANPQAVANLAQRA